MKAKVNVGDLVIELPVEHLEQQTAINSIFDNVPVEKVDVELLIEANLAIGVNWFYHDVYGVGRVLQVSIPTEHIVWEA